ncbi:MAG: leucine-rich repeat protein [Oscillospiraceae bacterium]|nr:leucine-rich repeat protein [Oscillospiraceae bacterium]
MRKNNIRLLALILTIMVVVNMFPVTALANDEPFASSSVDPDETVVESTQMEEADSNGSDNPIETDMGTEAGSSEDTDPVDISEAVSSQAEVDVPSNEQGLELELTDGYVLSSKAAPFTEQNRINAQVWQEEEIGRYKEARNESEDDLLTASFRGDNDKAILLEEETEFCLSCNEWNDLTLESLTAEGLKLYLSDGSGQLIEVKAELRQLEGECPGLYFRTNRLEDLLLTKPKQETGASARGPVLRASSAGEVLLTGVKDGLRWTVLDNGDGMYTLDVRPEEGSNATVVPKNFYDSIKSEISEYTDGLTDLVVGGGITTVNAKSFLSSPFVSVTFEEGFKTIAGDYSYDGAFAKCTNLKEIHFPSTMETLGYAAFKGCTSLEEIDFSTCPSLKKIETCAFYQCSALKQVDLSPLTSLTEIQYNTFKECTSLTSAVFPSGLKTLNGSTFEGCSSLKTVDMSETQLTVIQDKTFMGCRELESVKLPSTLQEIRSYAFSNCEKLKDIDFTSLTELKTIRKSAFSYCRSFRSIDLSNTQVETIEETAFNGCYDYNLKEGVTEVKFPSTLKTIGKEAFYYCPYLETADLSQTQVTQIGASAFSSTLLKDVTLPETLTSLGANAFNAWSGTDKAYCVETIDLYAADGSAFSADSFPFKNTNMTHFKSLTVRETVDVVKGDFIDGALNRGGSVSFVGPNDLHVNKGSVEGPAGKALANMDGDYYVDADGVVYSLNKDGTAELVFVPEGVTSFVLPETITTVSGDTYLLSNIRAYAFSEAKDLTEVTITKPENITIEPHAFLDSKVSTVNGETAIDPSEYAGVSEICDFPLVNPDPRAETDPNPDVYRNGYVNAILGFFGAETDENNVYQLKTGEDLTFGFNIEVADNENMEGGSVRIYLLFSDDNYTLGNYSQVGVTYELPNQETGRTLYLTVHDTHIHGLYYYDVTGWLPADTSSSFTVFNYPNATAGGDLIVWAVPMTKEELEANDIQTFPRDGQYLHAHWGTQKFPFWIKKEMFNKATPALAGDGTEENHVYVTGLDFLVSTGQNGASDGNVAGDFVTHMIVHDTLTPPEEMILSPKMREAIENGRIRVGTVDTSSQNSRRGIKIEAQLEDGTWNTVATVTAPSYGGTSLSSAASSVKVSVVPGTEQLQLQVEWYNTSRRWDEEGNLYATQQMQNSSLRVTYGDQVYELKDYTEFLDENGNLIQNKVGRFHNEVENDVHYSYSSDDKISAEVDTATIPLRAGLTMSKRATIGNYVSAYLGSPFSYEINIQNIGIFPNWELAGGKVTDTLLSNRLYLQPKDMISLFKDADKGKLVEIKIVNADICLEGEQMIHQTVLDVNGNEVDIIAQSSSGEGTQYPNDPNYQRGYDPSLKASADITLRWNEDQTLIEVRGGIEADVQPTAEAIQELFDRSGFVIVPSTTYTVSWDFPDSWRLNAGANWKVLLPAHLKDSFMLLAQDQRYYRFSSSRVTGNCMEPNWAYAYAKDETQSRYKAKNEEYVILDRDWTLYKTAKTPAGSVSDNGSVTDGTVIDYTVSANRDGNSNSESYPQVLPMTDKLSGSQYLLLPVEGNEEVLFDGGPLSEAGLETIEVDGKTYYRMNKDGVCSGVMVGGRLADTLEIKRTSEGVETLIKWYFTLEEGEKYIRSRSVTYKAICDIPGSGAPIGADGLSWMNNMAWISDHQSHRIYDTLGLFASGLSYEKWILQDDELLKYSAVSKGQEVTYKIHIANMVETPLTIVGSQIYDALPRTYSLFSWSKDNVKQVRYEVNNGTCETEGDEYWWIDGKNPRYSWSSVSKDYFYLKWNKDFSVTLNDKDSYLDIYVTLVFPTNTDSDVLWDNYVLTNKGETLVNTFYLNGHGSEATHNLAEKSRAVIRKGVLDTVWNPGQRGGFSRKDRFSFSNAPSNKEQKPVFSGVLYYTVIYNSGISPLYLEDMEDHLPRGFVFREMGNARAATHPANNTSYPGRGMSTSCLTEYWGGGPSDAMFIQDNGKTVTYMNASVTATVTSPANDTQGDVISFSFKNISWGTNPLKYNEKLGKYYLAPGEAVRFCYMCTVGPEEDTDEIANNIVAMPVYDPYNMGVDLEDKEKIVSYTVANVPKNDGDAYVLEEDEAEALGFERDGYRQWLASDVTVTRGKVTPGIQKTVGGTTLVKTNPDYKTVQGSTGYSDWSSNYKFNYGNKYNGMVQLSHVINWRVRVYNDTVTDQPTNGMMGFTLEDTVDAPYGFTGEVYVGLYSGNGEPIWQPRKLFTIASRKWGQAPGIQLLNGYYSDWNYSSFTLNFNAAPLTGAVEVGRKYRPIYTVQLLRDKDGNETLKVRMVDDYYSFLPDGAYMEFTFHTMYMKDQQDNQKLYFNTATVHPDQYYDPDTVSRGKNLTDENGAVITGQGRGVSSTSMVNMVGGFGTSAVKTVTEVEKPSNSTSSNNLDANSIRLTDRDSVFRYTLDLDGPEAPRTYITRLTVIDMLPEPGDHALIVEDSVRDSDFKVGFNADDLDIQMWIKEEGGGQVELSEDQFLVELSEKTSFDDEDWAGAGDGWIALSEATKEQILSARTIRFSILDPDAATKIMSPKFHLHISFNAVVDDPDADPGEIAWNSFAYRYWYEWLGTKVEKPLGAETLAVGVQYPYPPELKKVLVDEEGEPFEAPSNATFEFLIYEGAPISALEDPSTLSPKQIADILADGERKVLYVPVSVAKGEHEGSAPDLNKAMVWTWEDGDWKETEERWLWKQGQSYTLLEQSSDPENYTLTQIIGINGRTEKTGGNNFSFVHNGVPTYDGKNGIRLTAYNQHNEPQLGELKITKNLERFAGPDAATFVFQIEAVLDGKNVYSNVTSLTFSGPMSQSVVITGIPVGAEVTVTEVYSGSRYETVSEPVQTAVILSPEEDDAPCEVVFINDYDDTGKGGHGILNTFNATVSPEDPGEFVWDDWEKPDMNNA